ncbi:peptide chain release factor N(5)-glutamine methyltransferase [Lactobacillus sp. PV037]|uniref:peptide chain release factor N(5)-glutamine methyltransferase n=1 Tax=Lactobacillus sp. PV037 TaxID=2594496 RepID=UPI002240A466|nr:peptide chain release factor N(5)-glutamine methyltransferase [Lactobacillus sp. PV037]QNQ83384.1 peptide chain release factor N(5)-glutamine methyltransferase [Lactobacillus sp. PV037]
MPSNFKQIKQNFLKENPEILPEDVDYVLAERLDYTPSEFQMHLEDNLTAEQLKVIRRDLKKLAKGVSPQYIVGYSWFLGYKILVKRGVLIPRFETEELVLWALDNLSENQKVLDLGTGSGAIMVALANKAKEKNISNLTLYASDISDNALRESEENFLNYDLDVITRKANVLIGLEKFDLIVSNPPYIKLDEKNLMDKNVIQNEPEEALFGGEDGLDFYRRFAQQVKDHLNKNGHFFLEFGFNQQDDLAKLFAKELPEFEIEFKKDLSGKPRMVHGRWKN